MLAIQKTELNNELQKEHELVEKLNKAEAEKAKLEKDRHQLELHYQEFLGEQIQSLDLNQLEELLLEQKRATEKIEKAISVNVAIPQLTRLS